MNGNKLFLNREDAGKQLGTFLAARYDVADALILGIPRGGVAVAYYVAEEMQATLSLIVSKKLPFPGNEEYGFGAIAEEQEIYISESAAGRIHAEAIRQIIHRQSEEVARRVKQYRMGKPLPDMTGRTAFLIDDGIATGVTLVPALRLCRRHRAARVIIATPVSGRHFDQHLKEADDIEILAQPEPFYAVGQVYEAFDAFTDDQLLQLLSNA